MTILGRRVYTVLFIPLIFLIFVTIIGFSSCTKECKKFELRAYISKWVGGALKNLPIVLRLDYQYHIPTQQGQMVVYREVTELFTGKTDLEGRFTSSRNPPRFFENADLKSLKFSLVYLSRSSGPIVLDPSRTREYSEGETCVSEQHYIVKNQVDLNADFIRKRVLDEQKWANEHQRDILHNGVTLSQ